jgi:tetratricopeptide (TPR) repeat protein
MLGRHSPGRAAVGAAALALLLAGGVLSAQVLTLEQAGWQELSAARYREAAATFDKALAAEPRNARLHLGAGAAAYFERRDTEAQAFLRRALELSPTLRDARELLGLVLYRTGDLNAAVREYETLAAGAAPPARVTETLARWRRESELRDRMTIAPGNGFVLSFEGPPDAEIATRAAGSLDRAAARIGQVLGTLPLVPVSVVLYSNEQFRDITRAPDWAAGAFDGIVRIPVRDALADAGELDRVVAHEFTHAVVHSLASHGVPVWLNEGLATVLESDGSGEAESAVAASAEGRALSLRLLAGPFGRLPSDAAVAAYGKSALAVRRLLEESGGFAIANLLRDLAEGAPFEQAFERRTARSFRDFEAGLAAAP